MMKQERIRMKRKKTTVGSHAGAPASSGPRRGTCWWVALVLALVVLGAFGAQAQEPETLNDILGKTERYFQDFRAFSAQFTQITKSASAAAMASEASGRFYYLRPKMMRWEYETPESQIFIANGELAWLYVPAEQQISLFGKDRLFSSPFIRTLFEGVLKLREHFEIRMDSRETTATTAVLILTPMREDPNVQALKLWIDRAEGYIAAIQSQDALGNSNRIDFTLQRKIPKLPTELFQLEVPTATAVIDQDGQQLSPEQIRLLQSQLRQTR